MRVTRAYPITAITPSSAPSADQHIDLIGQTIHFSVFARLDQFSVDPDTRPATASGAGRADQVFYEVSRTREWYKSAARYTAIRPGRPRAEIIF